MATTDEIAALRLMINEPDNVAPYTDETLSAVIDTAGSTRLAASSIWSQKAAGYAGAVDIQEGNSRRSLSQLQSQALKMAESFATDPGNPSSGRGYSRTRKIDRQ